MLATMQIPLRRNIIYLSSGQTNPHYHFYFIIVNLTWFKNSRFIDPGLWMAQTFRAMASGSSLVIPPQNEAMRLQTFGYALSILLIARH